jgi:hypothetical protein
MIVRVQGSGQYRLAQAEVDRLHQLDHQLVDAVHAHDEQRTHALLKQMIELVQTKGSAVGDDDLVTSDTILPHDTVTVEEVQALLHEEGLVPSGLGQGV